METLVLFDMSIQKTLKLIITCQQPTLKQKIEHDIIHKPKSILSRLCRNRSSSLPKINLYNDYPIQSKYITNDLYLYEYV